MCLSCFGSSYSNFRSDVALWVLRDYELAKATFGTVNKLLPGNSDVAWALSAVNRRLGQWNESLAAVEAGLDLDPRNGELITTSAWTYGMLRQFPMALKRYDQATDIIANDPDLMSLKAGSYQAQEIWSKPQTSYQKYPFRLHLRMPSSSR